MSSRTVITHASPNLLRQLARTHLREFDGLTLVPNLAAGRSLRQLARTALPTTTFAQLARRQLFRAGWTPLEPAERTERLAELLSRLPLDYFGPLVTRPGTAPAFAEVIRNLLRSDAAFLPEGRDARENDLRLIHRTWVLELLRDSRYDPAVPEFFASRTAIESQPVTVSGFAYLDASQVAYLDRVASDGSVIFLPAARADELQAAHRTAEALTRRGWQWEEVDAWRTREDPRLQRPGDQAARTFLRPDLPEQPDISVLTLPGVVEETREVLRQVKLAHQFEGRPWAELAIVVRDEQTYLPPLLETAERYGVPLLSQARLPLLTTPLGELLRHWTDAALLQWPYELTRALLTHPLLQLPFDANIRARQFGRRTPRGLKVWGEEAVLEELDWPEQAPARTYLEHLSRALERLGVLDRQRSDAGLGVALKVLQDALHPLGRAAALGREECLTEIQTLLGGVQVPVMPNKSGVRLATPLSTLGHSYQKVWVLGLSEGQFPRPSTDPPLLDANLRTHWSQGGVSLPGGIESQGIERALFFHAVACAREALTLTRPEVTAAGRLSETSPFLRAFSSPRPPAEFHAGSGGEARIQQARTGQLADPGVRERARQEEARELGQEDSPFLPGLVDPEQWTWSASQFHQIGSCRYHWLANKVMNLTPLPEPLRGLDPLGQGSLYHQTLENLLRPYVDQSPPTTDELRAALPDAFEQATRKLLARGEIETGPLWAVERQDHLRVLTQAISSPDFLAEGRKVVGLERKLEGSFMAAGVNWALTGFADRIDEDAQGQQLVTDYKLSSYISRVKDAGENLRIEVQLPVYLKLTGATQGRYYSLKKAKTLEGTGPGWPESGWNEHAQEVETFLGGVRDALRVGDYRARPDRAAKACQYCDLQPLCRFQSFAQGEQA